ncbi:alpha/beta fold hydrolase BchO [Ideonella sp. DXS29W]|uniref:Alpha/beta fold hydrolase BchO n=1 Tax=Ideonella lacteola TaxID=2984193 RepID=A0ABU9BMT5_9BURK
MNWDRDGLDWPNRQSSGFVQAAGLRWHVQRMGRGPVLLLLHGTGSATHSWRDLMPLLASEYHVVAPDLPGHGFSDPAPFEARSLPGMARAVASLLQTLDLQAECIGGHSAGAAIGVQMALSSLATPRGLVLMGAALLPFKGLAGYCAAPLARLIARSAAPRWAALRAGRDHNVQRLIDATGSRIDPRGVAAYRTLLRSPEHIEGALALMGGWDLAPLTATLPRLQSPTLWLHGANDRTVPETQAIELAKRIPQAQLRRLAGLGHLAHEEQPELHARLILEFLHGVSRSPANPAERSGAEAEATRQ